MLDVGAAAGDGLKGFVDRGWQVAGLEPNQAMVGFRRQLGRSRPMAGVISSGIGLIPDRVKLPYPAWDLKWMLFGKVAPNVSSK